MAKIATRETKLSNLLKWEQAPHTGIARAVETVTFAEGMEIGQVLKLSGDKYVNLEVGDEASVPANLAVLIDSTIYDGLAAGDAELAVLKGDADCIVVREQLKTAVAFSEAQMDALVAALPARIQVGKQV